MVTLAESDSKCQEADYWIDDDMGTWSIKDGINKGVIPNPLDDPSQRKYLCQCTS